MITTDKTILFIVISWQNVQTLRKTIILEVMESSQFIQSLLKDKNILENTFVDHKKGKKNI